jgi:parvulin-like peptidyl-prolyl isomerase
MTTVVKFSGRGLSMTIDTIELCLDISDAQILSNLSNAQRAAKAVERLQSWESFPELMRRIAIDDLIEAVAYVESIDLEYTSEEFDKFLTEIKQIHTFEGMNVSQLSAIAERELKLQKFKQGKWGSAIEAYFQNQQSGLDSITFSVLQIADGAHAQELFFRIESGSESFAEIAIDYSQGNYAENGGSVGPLLLRELPLPIEQIISQLQPGQLSTLFQIDNYYTLFRLDELSPAQLDDRMERFLIDELFTNWVNVELPNRVPNKAIGADRIVYYLSRSELLISYLQQLIIEETLADWEKTPECIAPAEDLPPQQRGAVLLQQYQSAKWGHLLKTHFLKSKSQLDRVLFSLVQVTDLSLAQELYYQIGEQKHSFHQIARIHSQHSTASNGGTVGPIGLAQLNPLIQHYLTGIAAKELSPLFRLDDDYLFLRVERWLPAQFNEQTEQLLLDRLFGQWLQQEIRTRLDNPQSISFSSVSDLVESHNGKERHIPTAVELKALDPEPELTGSLSPTSSFFFPRLSPSGNILPHALYDYDDPPESGVSSSFFFPKQEPITAFTSEPVQSHTSVRGKFFITFLTFFSLFLGLEIGLVYWWNSWKVESISPRLDSSVIAK